MTIGIIHMTFCLYVDKELYLSLHSYQTFRTSLCLSCLGAIIEEIIFRDFLHRYMLLYFNTINTNIFNSLLFSLAHLSNIIFIRGNAKCIFSQSIFSFTEGYIFNLTGNIFVSIALHLTWNMFSVLSIFLISYYFSKKNNSISKICIARPKTLEEKLKIFYTPYKNKKTCELEDKIYHINYFSTGSDDLQPNKFFNWKKLVI